MERPETETVALTERLRIRQLSVEDAPFMLDLVNDPDWLRFIGDRGVRSVPDAEAYLRNGAIKSYEACGFGLYAVERRLDGVCTGICGLVRRAGLDDVDLGFAFLPDFRGLGYATEASRAVLDHARDGCGLTRLVAITNPDNDDSMRVLVKLGFSFQRHIRLSADATEVSLYLIDLPAASS